MPIRISISGNYYIFSVAISGIIWDVKYTNIIYVQLELAKDTTQLQMALGHVQLRKMNIMQQDIQLDVMTVLTTFQK